MLGVTGFGLLFTPAFYTFVRSLGRRGSERDSESEQYTAREQSMTHPAAL
jgi:hypothetical protein